MVKHSPPCPAANFRAPARATGRASYNRPMFNRQTAIREGSIRLLAILALLGCWPGLGLATEVDAEDIPPSPAPMVMAQPTPAPSRESSLVPTSMPTPPSTPTSTLAPGPAPTPPVDVEPLRILEGVVAPGEVRRLAWRTGFGYGLVDEPVPVIVAHGAKPGPTLCLTSAVHGDELNGIEIVRRVLASIDPVELRGTVIGVPIVNVHGFQRRSRYMPDRRDLNRHFPGDPQGSLASRVAHSFFHRIVLQCDSLVDLHTGSFQRTNLPQLRADLRNHAVVEMTRHFGAVTVLHSPPSQGTLRAAATAAGIPTVTFEVGEPNRLQAQDVARAVTGVQALLAGMEMSGSSSRSDRQQPVFYKSRWVRVDRGGILFSTVKLGQSVAAGEVLGTVTDPLSNVYVEIRSPFTGRVLGKALNQFVMPGFAAFRVGVETSEGSVVREAASPEAPPSADESTADDQPPS